MTDPERDVEIDALYQLPLSEFTAARNALAKSRGGTEGPAIRSLDKPHAAAWGVNLLFGQCRAQYDAVIAAAVAMRQAHARLISGQAAEGPDAVPAAEAAHHRAIREATAAIEALMRDAGAPASASTVEAIRETLLALPSEEPAGRLARPLKPLGFSALMALGVAGQHPAPQPGVRGAKADGPDARAKARREQAELAKRKTALARALRAAETAERDAESSLGVAQKALTKVERDHAATRDRLQFLEKQRDDAEQEVRRRAREVQDAANARTRAAQERDALIRQS